MNKISKIIFLMGPTSSGKTKLAIELCKYIPSDIISVDSILVYRYLNIGSSKPNFKELELTPHKLIDIKNPLDIYSSANFYHDAINEIKSITNKNRIPLLVGGTMLYFKLLLNGMPILPKANYELRNKLKLKELIIGKKALHDKLKKIDPVSANRIHPNDTRRVFRALEVFFISGNTITDLIKNSKKKIKSSLYQFAIIPPDKDLFYKNIKKRFYNMLDIGFENEVSSLYIKYNINKNTQSMQGIGYKQMLLYLLGDIDYNTMINQAINATNKLVKKQMTWIRMWKNLHILNNSNFKFCINKIIQIINK